MNQTKCLGPFILPYWSLLLFFTTPLFLKQSLKQSCICILMLVYLFWLYTYTTYKANETACLFSTLLSKNVKFWIQSDSRAGGFLVLHNQEEILGTQFSLVAFQEYFLSTQLVLTSENCWCRQYSNKQKYLKILSFSPTFTKLHVFKWMSVTSILCFSFLLFLFCCYYFILQR